MVSSGSAYALFLSFISWQRALEPHLDGLDRDEFCHWDKHVRKFRPLQAQDWIPGTILVNLDSKQNRRWQQFLGLERSTTFCRIRIALSMVDDSGSLGCSYGNGLVQRKVAVVVGVACNHRNPSCTCHFHSNCFCVWRSKIGKSHRPTMNYRHHHHHHLHKCQQNDMSHSPAFIGRSAVIVASIVAIAFVAACLAFVRLTWPLIRWWRFWFALIIFAWLLFNDILVFHYNRLLDNWHETSFTFDALQQA